MDRLLVPPAIVPVSDHAPMIFLAGPIQGSDPWQNQATEVLLESSEQLIVANPRRASLNESDFVYAEQVDWETQHLRRAASHGVILFWLAKEVEHNPERAYAQTTRFELAEWKMRHQSEGTKIVIGIEDGFSGAKYIRHRVGQDCPDIPILDDLLLTCQAALDRI